MRSVSVLRVSSLSVVKLLFLFELFCTTLSENSGHLQSDSFLGPEIANSRNFLDETLANQGRRLQEREDTPPISNDDWNDSSEESGEFSDEKVSEPLVNRNNEEHLSISAENSANGLDLPHQSEGGVHEVQSSLFREKKKKNHYSVEIKFHEESDSDAAGSLPDILEKALGRSISTVLKEPLPHHQLLPQDICSVSNHSFYDRQTCSSGHQYKLEPHVSSKFSDDLKVQMLEKYPPRKETMCGYRRRMKRDKDVTERALCPFQWVVSKRNPSRIPEYLYEAKCSCADCAELKSRIRVLWRVGCEDKLHVYREGWEEISVACVPTKPAITGSKQVLVVHDDVTPPE